MLRARVTSDCRSPKDRNLGSSYEIMNRIDRDTEVATKCLRVYSDIVEEF